MRQVVYMLDENKPDWWVMPPFRPRLYSDIDDLEAEPQPPQNRTKARSSDSTFIRIKAGVDGDVIGDESDGNDKLADFIFPNDVKY